MRARAWVLLLAAGFALLQFASVTGRATPDTRNYVSYALSLGGASMRESAAGTIDHYCGSRAATAERNQRVDVVRLRAPSPAARVAEECRRELWRKVDRRLAAGQTGGHIAPFTSERFQRIFEVRPGYPVLLAPFVAVFGVVWGVWLASVLIAATGGVLAFLVLRAVRAPTPVALTGQALYYVLPCGATAMRPMTEGLLLALTLAALWGCALAAEGRVRAGVLLVGGALSALFTVKHSQALFLGVCLVGACAVVAVRRARGGAREGRGPVEPWVRAVGAVSAGAVVCTLAARRAAALPDVHREPSGPAHRPLHPPRPGPAVAGVPGSGVRLLGGVGASAADPAVAPGRAGGGRVGCAAAAAGVRVVRARGRVHGDPQPGRAPGHHHLGRPADRGGVAAAGTGAAPAAGACHGTPKLTRCGDRELSR